MAVAINANSIHSLHRVAGMFVSLKLAMGYVSYSFENNDYVTQVLWIHFKI